jgi:hypothetical protein
MHRRDAVASMCNAGWGGENTQENGWANEIAMSAVANKAEII